MHGNKILLSFLSFFFLFLVFSISVKATPQIGTYNLTTASVFNDTAVHEVSAEYNFGRGATMRVENNTGDIARSYIKIDLNSLTDLSHPDNITSALYCSNQTTNLAGTRNVTVLFVNNTNWIEGNGSNTDCHFTDNCNYGISWNGDGYTTMQPCGNTSGTPNATCIDLDGNYSSTSNAPVVRCWNITNSARNYNITSKSFSIMLTQELNNSLAGNERDFATKENTLLNPFMTISYYLPNVPPTIGDVKEPTDPTKYVPNAGYMFNATVCDLDGNTTITKVMLNWNGTNSTNITTFRNINDTCSEYYTTKTDLKAALYQYFWYANDTFDVWASTSLATFTVSLNDTPMVYSWSLNDTYISMSQVIRLSVNASIYDNVLAEVQTSGGTNNYTLTSGGGNYTRTFSSSDLGTDSINSSFINITKIFIVGKNYTTTSNVTTLQFDYGSTYLSGIADDPDPVVNLLGNFIKISTKWHTNEATELSVNKCMLKLADGSYSMTYNSTSGKYEDDILVGGSATGTYGYNITCYNESYGNATGSGTFLISASGVGGMVGGGGGGGGTTTIVVANASFTISPSSLLTIVTRQGKTFDVEYRIKNNGVNDIEIRTIFSGEYYDIFKPEILQTPTMAVFPILLPESVVVKSGETGKIIIRMNVPIDLNDSTYEFQIGFEDMKTKAAITTPIRIKVSSSWGAIKDFLTERVFSIWEKFKMSLELKKGCDSWRMEDSICIKNERIVFSLPWFGAISTILAFIISYIIIGIPKFMKSHKGWKFTISLIIGLAYIIFI